MYTNFQYNAFILSQIPATVLMDENMLPKEEDKRSMVYGPSGKNILAIQVFLPIHKPPQCITNLLILFSNAALDSGGKRGKKCVWVLKTLI